MEPTWAKASEAGSPPLIDTNNADALQCLLDFSAKHLFIRPTTTSLLPAEPASLRVRVTKDAEGRFF